MRWGIQVGASYQKDPATTSGEPSWSMSPTAAPSERNASVSSCFSNDTVSLGRVRVRPEAQAQADQREAEKNDKKEGPARGSGRRGPMSKGGPPRISQRT